MKYLGLDVHLLYVYLIWWQISVQPFVSLSLASNPNGVAYSSIWDSFHSNYLLMNFEPDTCLENFNCLFGKVHACLQSPKKHRWLIDAGRGPEWEAIFCFIDHFFGFFSHEPDSVGS